MIPLKHQQDARTSSRRLTVQHQRDQGKELGRVIPAPSCSCLRGAPLMMMRTAHCALGINRANASSRDLQGNVVPEDITSATRRGAIVISHITFAPTLTDFRRVTQQFHIIQFHMLMLHLFLSNYLLEEAHFLELQYRQVFGSLVWTTKWTNRLHQW